MSPALAELRAPVTVRRSAEHVPIVEAAGLADAWAGLGFAVATDRLFQLDLLRRDASGRLSELFGESTVERDITQRREGLVAAADRAADALPPGQSATLAAYTAGINAAIAASAPPLEHGLLGVEVEQWRPRDSLLVALLLSQMLSGDGEAHRMRAVMERCLPVEVVDFMLGEADPYLVDLAGSPVEPRAARPPVAALSALLDEARAAPPAGSRQIVSADDRPAGSNAVALSGRHTADGRALLANDMHLPLGAPSILYRAGLRWPGGRVDGVTVPGLPVFVAGTSGTLAWGATRLSADVTELVALDPADVALRRETIRVRGADPVEVEIQNSDWGPITGTAPDGRPLARHWVGRDAAAIDLGLGALATAKDVADAAAAARRSGGAPLNILLADGEGHVGWTISGRFPARRIEAGVVEPGQAWTGHRSPEQLPQSLDPEAGILVSANNGTPAHRHPAGLAANHFSARRAARMGELLAAADAPWTEKRLLALQADADAAFYAFYRDLALRVLTEEALRQDPARRSLHAAIQAWDGTANTDAVGLAVLVAWRELLRESLFAALLNRCAVADESFVYCWHSHEAPLRAMLGRTDLVPPPHRDHARFLLFELDLSAALLRRLVPDTDVDKLRWGRLNPSGIRHPLSMAAPELSALLDLPQDEVPGCPESVCAARPGFGPAMRLVASPGRPESGLLNLPGGQSGDPRSRHYRDQFSAWLSAAPTALAPPPADADIPVTLYPTARNEDG